MNARMDRTKYTQSVRRSKRENKVRNNDGLPSAGVAYARRAIEPLHSRVFCDVIDG